MNCLIPDPWLSNQLQRPCFRSRTENVSANRLFEELQAIPGTKAFVYARVECQDMGTLACFQDAQFRVVDTNLNFSRKIISSSVSPVSIREATPRDEASVTAIAGESFKLSRFHLDPKLETSEAAHIKRQWARNYFQGARGDLMVVGVSEDGVSGFASGIWHAGGLVIDLIAVAPSSQNKGLGSELIAALETRTGIGKTLIAGTQAANVPSVRFYERLGFRLQSSSYLLHWHK